MRRRRPSCTDNFRIFIDAATLKLISSVKAVTLIQTNFRIFIDAATLKQDTFRYSKSRTTLLFPHLYRCGHIEAYDDEARIEEIAKNFRIFIDAATLKRRRLCRDLRRPSDFRIFIDAATLKLDIFMKASNYAGLISASL